MADALTRQQQRELRKAQSDANQLAGLELREQQISQDAAQAAERANLQRQQFELQQLEFQRRQAVENFNMDMKIKARQQSLGYLGALATLNDQDPDFQVKAAALQSTFPMAAFDEQAAKITQTRIEANQKVRDANTKIFQDTGVNPDDFVRRDNGRFVGYDWAGHGNAVLGRRQQQAGQLLAGAPLGGSVTTKVGDLSVTTQQPTAAGVLADANVPVASPAAVVAGTPAGAVVAVQEGRAAQQQLKADADIARQKSANRLAQLRALQAKGNVFDAGDKANLDAIIKELESETSAERPETAPAAPKPRDLQGLKDLLKRK